MKALSKWIFEHQTKAQGVVKWDEVIFSAWSNLAMLLATWSEGGVENPSLTLEDRAKGDYNRSRALLCAEKFYD